MAVGDNETVTPILREAVLAMKGAQFALAADKLDSIASEMQADAKFLGLAAEANIKAKRPEFAVPFLVSLLKQRPNSHEVLNSIGDCLRKVGRYHDAVKYFDRSIALASAKPEYLYNFGLCLIEMQEFSRAESIFRRSLELRSNYVKGALGLVKALEGQYNWNAAQRVLESMLIDQTSNPVVWFRMAKVNQELGDKQGSISCLSKAFSLQPTESGLYSEAAVVAVALQENDLAIEWLEVGMQRYPEDATINWIYAIVRYELDDEDYLSHYQNRSLENQNPRLVSDYATLLVSLDRPEEAAQLLASSDYGEAYENADILNAHLRLLLKKASYQRIIDLASFIDRPLSRRMLVEAYLGLGLMTEADSLVDTLLADDPDNQYLIALKGSVLKGIEMNPAEAVYYDREYGLERFVVEIDLHEYCDQAELFKMNTLVSGFVSDLHVFKRNPLHQSVIGGTQSAGNLFSQPSHALHKLKSHLLAALGKVMDKKYFDEIAPVQVSRRHLGEFRVESSWSIQLKGSGHHKPHVHSKGWLSCVYYLEVPDEIETPSNSADKSGWLALGRPGVGVPYSAVPELYIAPAVGKLIIFPSYVWHETLPFKSNQPRITVAFDLIPSK